MYFSLASGVYFLTGFFVFVAGLLAGFAAGFAAALLMFFVAAFVLAFVVAGFLAGFAAFFDGGVVAAFGALLFGACFGALCFWALGFGAAEGLRGLGLFAAALDGFFAAAECFRGLRLVIIPPWLRLRLRRLFRLPLPLCLRVFLRRAPPR